ncbi:MFS transporter [Sphingomonas hengshuiensis]|uniref:MFS transporter n=1 Tax=Sphingomonas hengshuiensis TaxID=1609977 RepID=UPI00098216F0|nr:MFS transporter [Sphingomonas hengshuiensis]
MDFRDDPARAPETVAPSALAASRAIPLTVGACFFMEGLDATIIATSLPQIAEALHVTPHETSVALTAYLISVSIWLAASGWLADRFEAKRVFIASILMFILGSLVCGVSADLTQLIVGRFLQGMGGAMMAPVGRLILARSFPRNQLVRAMSYMIIPGLLGPMLGPVIGGMITTYFDWRWIFFINLPLGVLGVAMAIRFLKRFAPGAPIRFDGWGFVLVAVALVAILASLEVVAAESAFGRTAMLGLGIGVAACLAYGWHARRADPILDLRLLRHRAFAVAVLGGALSRVVLGATLFLFPLYFQLALGASAVATGYLMATLAVGQIALRLGIDPLLRHLGIRRLLVANSVAMGALLVGLLAFEGDASLWLLGAFLFLFGMLHAIQLSTLGALTFSGLAEDKLGGANSIAAVVQRLAMAIGISVAAILLGYASATTGLTGASFPLPILALSAVLLLSAASFLALRRGDGDDLMR